MTLVRLTVIEDAGTDAQCEVYSADVAVRVGPDGAYMRSDSLSEAMALIHDYLDGDPNEDLGLDAHEEEPDDEDEERCRCCLSFVDPDDLGSTGICGECQDERNPR